MFRVDLYHYLPFVMTAVKKSIRLRNASALSGGTRNVDCLNLVLYLPLTECVR